MASIRKRTWKSGGKNHEAWVVDYKDQSGKRAIQTFATKKEAEAWKVQALHEVASGIHTRTSASKTVAEAWEMWLEQCAADRLEFGTIRARKQHLRIHVEPVIGSARLSDLSAPLLYDFDAKLRDKGTSIAMRRKIMTNTKTMLISPKDAAWSPRTSLSPFASSQTTASPHVAPYGLVSISHQWRN